MNDKTIYYFECRKIFKNKITIITLVGIFLAFFALITINSQADPSSGYTKDAFHSVSERLVDDKLLSEARETTDMSSSVTDIADNGYQSLVRWMKRATGASLNLEELSEMDYQSITAEELYDTRLAVIKLLMNRFYLTESEIDWWMKKEAQIETPIRYQYSVGPSEMLSTFQIATTLLLVLSAVCLTGIFSNERLQKTADLILCSSYGKEKLFFIKLAAGETFMIVSAICILLACHIPYILLFGLDGIDSVYQIAKPLSSYPVSIGTMLILYTCVYFMSAFLYGMFAMALSVTIDNGVAATGIMLLVLILSMFLSIPLKFRALAQMWSLRPSAVLANASFADYRLFPFAGNYFTSFQVAPFVYLLIIITLLIIAKKSY